MKALEIDATVAEAYVALGSLDVNQWKWTEAEKSSRRAVELNPGSATAHSFYADLLERTGRVRESLAEMRRAYELDPLSPTVMNNLADKLIANRQYDEAIRILRKVLEMNPNAGLAYVHMAVAFLVQNKFPEALAELDRGAKLMPGSSDVEALRGYAYARTGRREAALDIVRKLTDPSSKLRGTGLALPALYIGLGDKDRAFEALNRACDQKLTLIDYIQADPMFYPLHSDPRFTALLRRMNLAQ